ncbi:MAG TPA: DUF1289 domain-containing protein [Sphingomonas sp.]|nr:DUF1289 domain-containing protein [Sphingomonas sp.]
MARGLDGVATPSPCTGVCTLAGDRCVGCGRTLDEIVRWTTMPDAERQAIVARPAPGLPSSLAG